MSRRAWLISGVVIGLIVYALTTFLPPYEDSNTISAPKNYYYLPVRSVAEVVCPDTKSGLNLIGLADIIAYPAEGRPNHYMIVATNATVKEADWRKPLTSDEDAKKFAELLSSFKPHTLFHLQRSNDKKVIVHIYARREGSRTDAFKFWISRFDKEWGLLDTQTYDPYSSENTTKAASSMMKRAYGADCRLIN